MMISQIMISEDEGWWYLRMTGSAQEILKLWISNWTVRTLLNHKKQLCCSSNYLVKSILWQNNRVPSDQKTIINANVFIKSLNRLETHGLSLTSWSPRLNKFILDPVESDDKTVIWVSPQYTGDIDIQWSAGWQEKDGWFYGNKL